MKRILTLLASLALVASGLHILPAAAAEEAPAVPDAVNIEDLVNDANYLNDQGLPTEFQGDNGTPADASTLGDILKVWFTNDATTVSAHIQTQAAIPASGQNAAIFHRVQVDPDGAGETCLWFQGGTTGLNNTEGAVANLRNTCGDADEVLGEGELKAAVGPEDTGIITITVPRSLHASLAAGGKLLTPKAETRNYHSTPARSATAPQIDNTKPGTDYLLSEGGATPTKPVKPAKPAKPAKPVTPVKNGCDNGKGKKKGCAKTPKPKSCASFTPGEAGKDKPTVVVTDAATEAKPLEQKVTLDASLNDVRLVGEIPTAGPVSPSSDFFNVQVDSASADTGLYASIEFPTRRDYDLNLFHPDGSYSARSRSFNPVVGTPADVLSAPGHGGEGTDHSEKLAGIKTSDCGGWTMNAENHLGEGGEMIVKLWLGPATIDPQEAGAELPH